MHSFTGSVRQIGYAVRDLGAALRQFEAMNGKAHEFWHFQSNLDASCNYLYRGEPAECRLDVALTTINGIDHEFIQVLEGPHPTADFVAAHGDGINHLALYLRDLSAEQAHAMAIGGEIVAQGEFFDAASPARRFCYIAFNDRPLPLYELIELKDHSRVAD
jgi:methylmalonyl-CoA/ethylmalonyl-CoA epimerase